MQKKKMSQHDPKMFDFSPGMQMFRQFWCNPKKFDKNTTDKHGNGHSQREHKLDKKSSVFANDHKFETIADHKQSSLEANFGFQLELKSCRTL